MWSVSTTVTSAMGICCKTGINQSYAKKRLICRNWFAISTSIHFGPEWFLIWPLSRVIPIAGIAHGWEGGNGLGRMSTMFCIASGKGLVVLGKNIVYTLRRGLSEGVVGISLEGGWFAVWAAGQKRRN
jgi:hypothetical protein